jgi:hypothetical protein
VIPTEENPLPISGKVIRKILSVITNDDKYIKYMLQTKFLSEREAVKMARTICSELKVGPTVDILSVEFQADRKKLTVFYRKSADVSLCKLIRKLHSAFKMRIWMENVQTMLVPRLHDEDEEKDGPECPPIKIEDTEMLNDVLDIFEKREQRYLELASIDLSQTVNALDGGFLPPQQQQLPALPSPSATSTPLMSNNSHDTAQSIRSEYSPRGGLTHHSVPIPSAQHAGQSKRSSLPHRPPPPKGYSDYLPQPPHAAGARIYPMDNSLYQTQRSIQHLHQMQHRPPPVYQAAQSYHRSAPHNYRSFPQQDYYHTTSGMGGRHRGQKIEDYFDYSNSNFAEVGGGDPYGANRRMDSHITRPMDGYAPAPYRDAGRAIQHSQEFYPSQSHPSIAPALPFARNLNYTYEYEPSIDANLRTFREYSPANPSYSARGQTPTSVYDWKGIQSLSPSEGETSAHTPASESYLFEGYNNELPFPTPLLDPRSQSRCDPGGDDSVFFPSQSYPPPVMNFSSSSIGHDEHPYQQQRHHQHRQIIQSENPLFLSTPLTHSLADETDFVPESSSYHFHGKSFE